MDKNVTKVRQKLLDRAKVGHIKYGVTTEREDLSLIEWLNHLQDELLDAAVYVERLKTDVNKLSEKQPRSGEDLWRKIL